jgi:hypothetical protein
VPVHSWTPAPFTCRPRVCSPALTPPIPSSPPANENPAILPAQPANLIIPKPARTGEYWANVTKGLNFTEADRVDPVLYNRILWRRLKGDVLYPGHSSIAETRRKYKEALKARNVSFADKDGAE